MRFLLGLFALIVVGSTSAAMTAQSPPVDGGEVRVPLPVYTQMLHRLADKPSRAPVAYAIGQADVVVTVGEAEGRFSASVEVSVQIEIFETRWTLVPVLPPHAALRHASVNGQPVRLVEGRDGLAWSTNQAGAVTMRLVYDVDATQHEAGYVLPLMTPRAAATTLKLSFPGTGIDLAVLPSADMQVVERNGVTHLSATVPATPLIMVSWRATAENAFAIGRAHYTGELRDGALQWTATFQVEVYTGQRVILPVMPNSVTLHDVRVDGEVATVVDDGRYFTARLQGRRQHEVRVEFQVPVDHDEGPPRAQLRIPKIPVSRFDLVLPGRKEIKVAPAAAVTTQEVGGTTRATTFIPMSDSVVFTWTEAVPEELRGKVRANASLYHQAHADEGVLHVLATIVYEITHGESNLLELEIPADAQVNRIVAPAGGVSDWAVVDSDVAGRNTINVFLERPVTGEYVLEVSYERLLGAKASAGQSITVPLLSAINVQRQRGMVALLSGPELTLDPVRQSGLSKVGENQLPAFIRDRITMTVAHTYKYTEAQPDLAVAAVAPERKQGQFDAQIDTLISLGDVTMKGSATVGIDIKSGTLLALALRVPESVNVLGVSGPSLRTHKVRAIDGAQLIDLAFTREMEGQFRIEVNYERIMDSDAADAAVATISVVDADVEHGRIAIEALTAVEVRATTVEQLSNLDINELPRQLVLKTTNPILLAYRYAQAKVPFKLALTITRHEEIDVQVAVIERAEYASLFTSDGLAVTSARLSVRNSRRQFLRLALPPGSEVWSVFVDGKPEKPAYAGGDTKNAESAVLIKMINSAEGFAVDMVYATPVQKIGHLGAISSQLPRPDMVVTHTRWDVFLPVGPRYLKPDSTMDLVLRGAFVNPSTGAIRTVARAADSAQTQMGQPLRISVPTQGIQFAFEKLYANRSADDATFSIRYVSSSTNHIGLLLSVSGVALLWIGVLAIGGRRIRLSRSATIVCNLTAVALLVASIGYLGTSPVPASLLALAIALVLALWWAAQRWRSHRQRQAMS